MDCGKPVISCDKTKWFGWIVDDVLYHMPRVENVVYDNTFMFTVDKLMVKNSKMMYPNTTNIIHLLHGGFGPDKAKEDKDIDVLFPGTIGKPITWDDFSEEPMPIEKFLADETMKLLEECPEIAVRTALEMVLNNNSEEMTTQLLLELTRVIRYIDGNVRYKCKHDMLVELLKKGYTVHMVGEGTDEVLQEYSDNIVTYGAQDIDNVIELMARAKIVINPLPPVFEEGFHERIFTAMLCKTACFTPYYICRGDYG